MHPLNKAYHIISNIKGLFILNINPKFFGYGYMDYKVYFCYFVVGVCKSLSHGSSTKLTLVRFLLVHSKDFVLGEDVQNVCQAFYHDKFFFYSQSNFWVGSFVEAKISL